MIEIDVPQAPNHDDYKRMLVFACAPVSEEERPLVAALHAKFFIWNHWTAFGTLPKNCDNCKDETQTQRALNCDEHGNPLPGGIFKNATD